MQYHYTFLLCFLSISLVFSHIFEEKFDNNNYEKSFSKQCSYDDHPECSEHFGIHESNGSKRLKISVFSTDHSFEKDSPTEPRSELALRALTIEPQVDYIITWNVKISHYVAPFEFCFFQLFANKVSPGPNVLIKWKRNEYELWVEQHRTNLKGNLGDDLNNTSIWRISFKMDMKKGYFKVERKSHSDKAFVLLGSMKGKTSCSNSETHYLKLGIYSQTTDVKDMTMYLSNLTIN